MITPPAWFIEMAHRQQAPRASQAEVEAIRAMVSLPVPASYFEFITNFGCPEFQAFGEPCCFRYTYREPGFEMDFQGDISHFMAADRVQTYYKNLALDTVSPDTPKFPVFMLPIGLDFSQSTILLECGGESDRIWFWEFQAEPWGEGNNVRLGFVAETLTDFLHALYVPQD